MRIRLLIDKATSSSRKALRGEREGERGRAGRVSIWGSEGKGVGGGGGTTLPTSLRECSPMEHSHCVSISSIKGIIMQSRSINFNNGSKLAADQRLLLDGRWWWHWWNTIYNGLN